MPSRIKRALRRGAGDAIPDVGSLPPLAAELLTPAGDAARRGFYLAVDALRQRYDASESAPADVGRPLTGYELRVFSQNGEDGVLAEVLRRVGWGTRRFVEIGAGSGTEGSCVALADIGGWSGLFVEADAELFARLEGKYRHRSDVKTVQAAVTPENVANVVASSVGSEVDVLSIDTDGRDYWLWKSLGSLARVVVIEYNASLGTSEALTVPLDHAARWDGTTYFGASLAALEELGSALGYELVHTDVTGVNAFFVRTEYAAKFPTGGTVPRGLPNYGLVGVSHKQDPHGRPFVRPGADS
jgi:hypothetical protein